MLTGKKSKTNFLAVLFLATVNVYSSCNANQLIDDDVNVLLEIVEDSNPNLVRIVHDKTADTSKILRRMVHGLNNNENRDNAIPIIISTVGAQSAANSTTYLLQNYTTFTVIIAAENSEDKIEAIVSDIDKRMHRKQLNKYLVVFHTVSIGTNGSEWTRKVFQLFWERRVLDVVLFYRDENSIKLKSFNPFQQFREIDFNANCSANELYASKLLNLNGYEFNIIALPVIFILVRRNNETSFEGVDGSMIEFVRRKMNVTFRDTAYEDFLPDMNAKLESGEAQMAIPVIAYNMRDSRYRVEITNSFQRMDFCVAAMKPNSETMWLNSGIFVSHSKYLLLGTLLIFAIIYKVFWSIHDRFQQNSDLVYESKESSFVAVFFMMYRAFFGDSLTYMPRSTSLRLLLIGWIFFCFLITSAITANLLSTLVQPAEIKELESVDDLPKHNLKLLIPSQLAKKFKDSSPELWKRLNATMESIDWKLFLNETEHQNPKFAYTAVDYVIEYILHKNVDKITKKPIYYKLKECIFNMLGAYHMEPGSAYLQRINELLGSIHQAGLYQRWFERAVFNMSVTAGFDDEEKEEEGDREEELPVVLTLRNTKGIFLLWLIGMALAFVVFLVEVGLKHQAIERLHCNIDCCRPRT